MLAIRSRHEYVIRYDAYYLMVRLGQTIVIGEGRRLLKSGDGEIHILTFDSVRALYM